MCYLRIGDFTQTTNGRANSGSRGGAKGVGSTGVDFAAGLALPDTDGGTLDGVLLVSSIFACHILRW